MDTPEPATPLPDELANPQLPVESVTPLEPATAVQSVKGDVKHRLGDVIETEQESQHFCGKARQLMQEADQWGSKLQESISMQISGARERARRAGCTNLEDSISFNKERDNIERSASRDEKWNFMAKALNELLEALEMIKNRNTQEADTLKSELISKFASLIKIYVDAHKTYDGAGQRVYYGKAHHEFLIKFLKIARGIDGDELPAGLEENVKAGIDTLIEYCDWEGSMDRGMDLLELVCPFYRTSAGKKMFKMIMEHLDGLMKMNLWWWLTAPASHRWKRESPNLVKEEEKEWKDYYQEACDDILRRNNLPEHKFEREGGGFANGNHWG